MLNFNNDNIEVLNKRREIFQKGEEKNAVLLIHGFTGSPYEMKYLGESIYKNLNYTTYIPRLPGHGTNSKDFRNTTANDWLKKGINSYLNLKSYYKNVSVIGLSMGSLISLLISVKFNVQKLILISPAIKPINPLVPFTQLLKFFIPKTKQKSGEERINGAKTEEDKIYHINYHKYHYLEQIAELYKLIKLSKKQLSEVNNPTFIIASKKDELVKMEGVKEIYNKIESKKKKLITFENSSHVITQGEEKEKCAQKTINFLKD